MEITETGVYVSIIDLGGGNSNEAVEKRTETDANVKLHSLRKTLLFVFIAFLIICFDVGSTVAFLNENSGVVTNSFRSGDIEYILTLNANASNANEKYKNSDVDMPEELTPKESRKLSVVFTADKSPYLVGYTFCGWYYDPECTEEYTNVSEKDVTVDFNDPHDAASDANKVEIDLFAKWTPNTYTVVYNGNDATDGSVSPSVHSFDSPRALNENSYTRTGYDFLGWSTDPDAVTPAYYDKESVINLTANNGEEVHIYAVWKRVAFTVSFDSCVDSVANPADITVSYQLLYGDLPSIERTGYTFSGWSLDREGTDFVTGNSIVNIAADHTLYAQWDAKTYTVRYHSNGGDGIMEEQIIKYDKPISLKTNTYTKNHYTFAGWALAADGDVVYIDEQIVVNLLESGYLDLYAVWIQNSYTVTFDYNGGTGSPDCKQVQNGNQYGALPTYPNKYSHLFMGWYTEPVGGKRVLPSTVVDCFGDHTLYAQWLYSPANDIIQNLVINNNPDDNGDGVVDDIHLNFTCSSYFERFNVPIENLVVGQRYKLSFTESNNANFGENEKGYSSTIYGSIITADEHLENSGSLKAESIADGGLIAEWSDRTKGNDWLNGPRDMELVFTAEASTMYWTWDMGLMKDGYPYDYNFKNIKLEPIVPTIEFSDKTTIAPTGSTAHIVSQTNTDHSTVFAFDGDGGCEAVYYKITGLTAGTTYTITFEHKYSGALINNASYDYGCGIMNSSNISATAKMKDMGTWASNCFVMTSVTDKTQSVTLTFKATSSTAYWVWNMANCSDSTNGTVEVEITSFSAVHSGGGSITYYTSSNDSAIISEAPTDAIPSEAETDREGTEDVG